jgi:hypothetical protein
MRFARAIPRIGALPELWTFECRDCAEATTEEKATLLAAAVHRASSPSGFLPRACVIPKLGAVVIEYERRIFRHGDPDAVCQLVVEL